MSLPLPTSKHKAVGTPSSSLMQSSFLGLLQIFLALQLVGPISGWRETLPPANTPTPRYQFLWTHRNGDDVFCDLVVHPGVDNRILFLDDNRFAIQMRLPEKYDHNFEFYKYICDLLWLKPYEISVVKGKTKFFKRLKFRNPGAGVDINYYRAIFTRLHKEYLSQDRMFQTEASTPHIIFPVSSTPQLYGILGRTHNYWPQRNPRIALVASPRRFNHELHIGGNTVDAVTNATLQKEVRVRTLGMA